MCYTHEMPALIFVLYLTMKEIGKMNLVWVGCVDKKYYVVNIVRSKSAHQENIYGVSQENSQLLKK